MPILADLKYQVELQMKKQQSNKRIAPSPKEKVMFLTRVLYEKKSLKEACEELQLSYAWGKAIWSEHISQYNKTKKLYKKNDSPKSPPSETEQTTKKVAGIKILSQGQHISKKFRIRVLIHGNPMKNFD